jgi:hypothetical protein
VEEANSHLDRFDSTKKKLIDGHPSTKDFTSTSKPVRQTEDSADFFAAQSLVDETEVDELDVIAH